jgi:argininosuccinate lyase
MAGGRAETVLTALHNTPFTDMNDAEGEVQAAGYTAFDTLDRALSLLTGFMEAVKVDEARVRKHIDESCITITEVADTLVREEGISFRQAHELASELARRMIAAGQNLQTLPMADFQQAFEHAIGRAPGIDEARFRWIATPEHFIGVREMFGGPGPKALAASLGRYRGVLDGVARARGVYEARIAAAIAERDHLVAAA